jgi:hypothetical protein
MNGYRNVWLIHGQPRGLLADALIEYRQFAADYPDDPYAPELLDVARKVHAALHEQRAILRATGTAGKANGDCGDVDAASRARSREFRRTRLAGKAVA